MSPSMAIEQRAGRALRLLLAIGLVACSSVSSSLPNGAIDAGSPNIPPPPETGGMSGSGGAAGDGGSSGRDAGSGGVGGVGGWGGTGGSRDAGGTGGFGGAGGFGGTGGFGGGFGSDGGVVGPCPGGVVNGGTCFGQPPCSLGFQTCTCAFANGGRRWSCR